MKKIIAKAGYSFINQTIVRIWGKKKKTVHQYETIDRASRSSSFNCRVTMEHYHSF